MIRDYLLEIFGIHEELYGGGEPVLVTLAPPIRRRRACARNFGSTNQEQDELWSCSVILVD
jgi:hypothetical protein